MTGQTERLRNWENDVKTLLCNSLTVLQVRSCSLSPTSSGFTKGEGCYCSLGYGYLTQIQAKQLTSLILVNSISFHLSMRVVMVLDMFQ